MVGDIRDLATTGSSMVNQGGIMMADDRSSTLMTMMVQDDC